MIGVAQHRAPFVATEPFGAHLLATPAGFSRPRNGTARVNITAAKSGPHAV
jgi:hypothetical protein